MRGVVSGLIWGGVVSVLGLGVVSQLAPLPGAQRAANDAANDIVAPEAEGASEPVKLPEPTVPEPEIADSAVLDAASPEPDQASMQGAAVPVAEAGEAAMEATGTTGGGTTAAEPSQPGVPEAAASETASAAMPVDPATPLPGEVPAHSPLATEAPADLESAAPAEPVAPSEPLLDRPEAAPSGQPEMQADIGAGVAPEAMDPGRIAALPAEPEPESESEAEPEPEAAPAPVPEAMAPQPVVPEPVAPLAPETGLPEAVAGVTTNRLPRIDAVPEAAGAAAAPEAEAEAAPADRRPLARFAAPFQNPANKPLYAILLLDEGGADLDRAALAAMPLPLTIVLDPAASEAGKLAAEYRKAGKEVAMLASGLPKGATPSDVQVSFEAHAKALPEAVAVVDLPIEGFQNNRKLAGDLLPVIKDQGRGLVTFDKGLNAGDQVARREGVPAALIFRELDAEGEAAPLIRRYLDRAAFKAVQDGRVAVLGRARPETIAALLEWSVEGRAGSVALAPLTAVLSVPE